MIITKEHQEAILNKYIEEGHNLDECSGFIDGMRRLIDSLSGVNNHNVDVNKKVTDE